MVPSGRPAPPCRLHDAVAEDRAHRAVHVADGQFQLGGRAGLDGRAKLLAGSASRDGPCACRSAAARDAGRSRWIGPAAAKTAEKSSPLAFQCSIAWRQPSRSTRPTMSSNVRKPSSAMICRASSATKVRKRTTYSALPGNRLRRSGSWVAMPDRAGAQVALPHQDAAQRDQGRGAEAEAFGPQQGGDDHVAAGLQLAVDLHQDAVAEAVEDQRLLGFGQAEFPGAAGMLDRATAGWRRCRRRGR